MPSVHQRIAEARQSLVGAGFMATDAAIDAEVLARHALSWDRAKLVAAGRDPVPEGFEERFAVLIARRAKREPVAFITGQREFWGLDFEVTPDVLIPRPETELIVEAACDAFRDRSAVRTIVDVGTGSGCLAVALAVEFPQSRVVAIDISAAALQIATRNARTHVPDRVRFVQADLLSAITGPVDLIVSNPPYVPSNVALAPDITRFEPAVALYSGTDGLSLLSRLIPDARARIANGGRFIVEFGFGQDDQVIALGADAGWSAVTTKFDLQAIPRVAVMS